MEGAKANTYSNRSHERYMTICFLAFAVGRYVCPNRISAICVAVIGIMTCMICLRRKKMWAANWLLFPPSFVVGVLALNSASTLLTVIGWSSAICFNALIWLRFRSDSHVPRGSISIISAIFATAPILVFLRGD